VAKIKSVFTCTSCSYQSPKWLGRCPECNTWNTFEEGEVVSKAASKTVVRAGGAVASTPKTISKIETKQYARLTTGWTEFDRVMGGGITRGSLTLIGGEPGIGKSTLLMEVCGELLGNKQADRILYVSGEESEAQVAGRSKRLGITSEEFYIYHETRWESVVEAIREIKPTFLVLDSIQTTVSTQLESPAGTLTQIREVTFELMNQAKSLGLTCFIIGHVTKEGNIAGPKVLEHMVDTVIYFEGDQYGQNRLLRSMKNRYGNTNEIGIFEMREDGLKEVANPSQYFLDQTLPDSYGRSLSCVLEGTRALFVEIQALVVENKFAQGRRVTQGLDSNRVALLVAVIDKYVGIPLSYNDIYVNVVGGIKLQGRETDLSIVASLLSSFYGKVVPQDTLFLGEVGLTGEVRSVPMMESRLREAAQLNYNRVVTSSRAADEYRGKFKIELVGLKRASDLKGLLF
jgi:DNA repair protein RadA/Sms